MYVSEAVENRSRSSFRNPVLNEQIRKKTHSSAQAKAPQALKDRRRRLVSGRGTAKGAGLAGGGGLAGAELTPGAVAT